MPVLWGRGPLESTSTRYFGRCLTLQDFFFQINILPKDNASPFRNPSRQGFAFDKVGSLAEIPTNGPSGTPSFTLQAGETAL